MTGESYQDVAKRALADLQKVIETYPDRTIVVVTHIGTMSAIAAQLFSRNIGFSKEPKTSIDFSEEFVPSCSLMVLETPVNGSIENEGQITMHINAV